MMKTLKKAMSVFLAVALLACLCIGMGMTGYAAGETIKAEAVGTYAESDAVQDITIRISVASLSEPYCGFYIDGGVTLPDGWTFKSYSTSNTAQALVENSDYNPDNGMLNYATSNLSDSIPANTYYEAVVTAPANASGTFNIVFNDVYCAKDRATTVLVSADTVTANVTITPAAEGYTVTATADKSAAAVGDTVNINLNVTNSDSRITTFNAFYGTLTYNATVFTYAGSNRIGTFTIDSSVSGKLTITRADGNITISGSDAELTIPFTAASTGTGTFVLSEFQVSQAAFANGNAPDAAVSGEPSVTVSQTYTVTFNANGHGTAPTAQSVISGEKAINPGTLTADGWTHDGNWYTEAACSNVYDFNTPVTDDIELFAKWTENTPDPTVTVETIANYCDGYTLIKATIENADGNVPTYKGEAMFKVENVSGKSIYDENAYYYVVKAADYNADLVSYAKKSAVTITKDGDANQTGLIDINDAQFVYNLYGSSVSYTYEPKAAQLLASDVNGDGSVDTLDCAAAIAAIK